jgi:hypothetical protein
MGYISIFILAFADCLISRLNDPLRLASSGYMIGSSRCKLGAMMGWQLRHS